MDQTTTNSGVLVQNSTNELQQKKNHVIGRDFSGRDILDDFTFTDYQYKHAKWYTKLFGNKQFIKIFWMLFLPALFWSFISGLIPILFNTIFKQYFPKCSELQQAELFSAEIINSINPLIISFVFAAFPVLGNYISEKNKEKSQEVLRWTFYFCLCVCIIGFILQEAFAQQISYTMVWNYGLPPNMYPSKLGLAYGTLFMRWLAPTCFFYLWTWLYIPTFSTMKSNKIIYYSSVVALIYFLIAYYSFLHCVQISITSNMINSASEPTPYMYGVANGVGGIYFGFIAIQPIILFIYSIFPKQFKVFNARFHNFFIIIWKKIYRNSKLQLHSSNINDYDDTEKYLLFFNSGFKVSKASFKLIFALSWVIFINEIGFNVLSIIFMVYMRSFGGTWPEGWNGINTPQLKNYIPAAVVANLGSHYHKMNFVFQMMCGHKYYYYMISTTMIIGRYMYTTNNAFTLLPQYFVAYYVGKKDRQTAYHNSMILTYWTIIIGLMLSIVVVIYSVTGPEAINPAITKNGDFYLHIEIGKLLIAPVYVGTYHQLWFNCMCLELILAITWTPTSVAYMTNYIMVSGGSKFIVFSNTLIYLFADCLVIGLKFTHFDDYFAFYFCCRVHVLLQCLIGVTIVACKGALWGIDKPTGNIIKQLKQQDFAFNDIKQIEVVND